MPGSRLPRVGSAHPNESSLRAEASNSTVVGIGASAGGLDACKKLIAALPVGNGMAFVLVQHLDPSHESMMVNLLAGHTRMRVLQVADGMKIEHDHVYIIPPGKYLSVLNGALHLSVPEARHGARLPFDFLLKSLAQEFGPRAACIVLSGTGADGSIGLKNIKDGGGLVIVQRPEEAGFDGMPRSAIATGAVDVVLRIADMPAALLKHNLDLGKVSKYHAPLLDETPPSWLPKVIEVLRSQTAHDFRLYKPGTLQRRIERRIGLSAIAAGDSERYLDQLKRDPAEVELLAKDLLINVTSFFRDTAVFDLLSKTVVPELIARHGPDVPLRVWVSGCSTGEEAYSLAIVCREVLATAKINVKLQVFASDVDADAIASAREGFYPDTIETDVSPERLRKFFQKENHGYRVSPALRATVTFIVQDVLIDPPFSRLDLVSCRNLLIYLAPEAQAKVISLFHFALREGGVLLLGSSETIGHIDGRFEIISKPQRVYRQIGRARAGDVGFSVNPNDGMRLPARQGQNTGPTRQAVLAELCRRYVLESFAPAAVLINRRHECLYSLGPINRYLRLVPGHPTNDLLAMAHDDVRSKLRAAIQQATLTNKRSIVAGRPLLQDGVSVSYSIDVQPVSSEGEDLLLICFNERPENIERTAAISVPADLPRIAELELELDASRTELQAANRNLEFSSEEQRAINEEALSINEEYQSTNEELLTSKEELQSLNEELTALNAQLQETLERQRTTSNDLQNVLYSTDVATLFLDTDLNIRFFTPATKAQFNVISGDIGRPLADLSSLSADRALTDDARNVLRSFVPVEREIETQNGVWFMRRILPYRTQDDGIEGVVITFTDVTERKRIKTALEEAKHQAERATIAKSRFLAAASHDLRQPLQTFSLLQGLLAKNVTGDKAQKLVARLDDTLNSMTEMLDALLDINRIDAGTVRAKIVGFPIEELLERMNTEFSFHAREKGLAFHVVLSGAQVVGDPVLVEQMTRNLLSNALKYTRQGKVLLGCRQHNDKLRIEVWDTGIGIPEDQLQAVFEEYHQIDNAARERSRGLGLGLSIVQRLAKLIGTKVRVHSREGQGSVFFFDLELAPNEPAEPHALAAKPEAGGTRTTVKLAKLSGRILIVEDDPEVRELLEVFLIEEGHRIATAPHGIAALELIANGAFSPQLILADYNLPNHLDGLRLVDKLRTHFQRHIPVIILTGDISADALQEIAGHDCVQLNKPVRLPELASAIQHGLAIAPQAPKLIGNATNGSGAATTAPTIFVVDDDDVVRGAIRNVLEDDGRIVQDFSSCEDFLVAYRPGGNACVLIDAYLPGMNGLELLQKLRASGHDVPAIMITGDSDVTIAVQAMKAGASDFVEKPISRGELLSCVDRAMEQARDGGRKSAWRESAATCLASLTARERQVMEMVLAGHPSKNIAADLQISQRTIENHRASIMKKTGAKSLPALARLALAAAGPGMEIA